MTEQTSPSENQKTVNGQPIEDARNKELEMRAKVQSLLDSYGVSEFTVVYKKQGCLGVSTYVKNTATMLEFSGFLQAFAGNAILKGVDVQTGEQ